MPESDVLPGQHPYAVGLTGGIASGKSTVAEAFATLGVPVLDADQAARAVVAPGTPGLEAIVQHFGTGCLAPDGSLDRAAMRRIVFGHETDRRALEAIVHPRVRDLLRAQLQAVTAPYAVLVIPLLAETWPAYAWLDRILLVDVPEETQRARLMRRDGIDATLADAMLAAQAPRTRRQELAQDVLENAGSLESLRKSVSVLHTQYLRRARARERDA